MGTFTIKKKNLKSLIIFAIIIIAVSAIGINTIMEKRNKQKEIDAYFRSIEKATEREYESLKREYDSYVETIRDYDYSYDFRYRYVVKVNKLLEQNIYETGWEYSSVSSFIDTQPRRESDDLEILRRIAGRNIFDD